MTVGTKVTTTAGPAEGARVDHDRGGFGRHKTYPSGTMAGAVTGIPEGRATETIYGLIRDGKHDECAKLLEIQLANAPDSRPALSLLGYCYYYLGNFERAAEMYGQLAKLFPENEDYAVHHAQSLYKASMYQEALRASRAIDSKDPAVRQKVSQLQALIAYEEDDLAGCRARLDECPSDDPDVVVNLACCMLKEGRFEEARTRFLDAQQALGFQADIAYNIALCYYRTKQFGPALKHLAEIIERGMREHPELAVGAATDATQTGEEIRSVGNTPALKETALVEAFNLKAAIEYAMGNIEGFREALTDMPPRTEEELDPVTLHNVALMNMESDPTDGFHKLNFLLQSPVSPPETFGNLLLLYCKPEHGFYDLAADVMAENPQLVAKHLPQEVHQFLEATILAQTAPEEAYRKFEELVQRNADKLRRLTRKIQEYRQGRDDKALKKSLAEYDETLDAYVPALMAQAKIYWDAENYQQVEKILRQGADYCADHEAYKVNMAHTCFMQALSNDEKYVDAIQHYEPIVREKLEDESGMGVLNVTAIVLANLCVAYIMTSQNEEAEELMRAIERAEEEVQYHDPNRQCFHLCIVNLVIGTLYCSKGNYEFGISRVIKSLEPYDKKLETDTWFYAKRCVVALLDLLGKHMITVPDSTMDEVMAFLDEAERHGREIVTQLGDDGQGRTLTTEARMIKKMFIKLRDL